MKVMTDMKVEVELVIEKVEEKHHSQELEPATRENDWWPASRDWTTKRVQFPQGNSTLRVIQTQRQPCIYLTKLVASRSAL